MCPMNHGLLFKIITFTPSWHSMKYVPINQHQSYRDTRYKYYTCFFWGEKERKLGGDGGSFHKSEWGERGVVTH